MEAPIFSEYEKERLKNIQRNEDYLQQLGFEGKPYAAPIANKVKPVKRKKMYNEENEYTEPVRRSSRVASQEPVSYIEVNQSVHPPFLGILTFYLTTLIQANILVTSKGKDSQSHALRSEQSVVYGDLPVGTKTGVELQPTVMEGVSSGATTGTCSSMNADLSYFLGSYTTDDALVSSKSAFQEKKRTSNMSADGKSAEEHRLCQPIAHYGKAAVMSLSNHGSLPRFSKYAGALEWLNCVYLWVNLGGTSGYSNAFSEKGRHIMWFGGSKMHQGKFLSIFVAVSVVVELFVFIILRNRVKDNTAHGTS